MSILSKLQALLTAANTTTGESDTTLTDAMQNLIDGYGQGGEVFQTGSFTPDTNLSRLQLSFTSPISYLILLVDVDDYQTLLSDTSGVRRMISIVRHPLGWMYMATNTEQAVHSLGTVSYDSANINPTSSINKDLYPSAAGSGYLLAGVKYNWIAFN